MIGTSEHYALGLEGAGLSWLWALPFVGILLTIALGPIVFSRLWALHHGKMAVGWAVITLAAIAIRAGAGAALDALLHAMLTNYLSFIVLLFALYVVSGGLLVTGNPCRYARDHPAARGAYHAGRAGRHEPSCPRACRG
jgi:hypothetical protein